VTHATDTAPGFRQSGRRTIVEIGLLALALVGLFFGLRAGANWLADGAVSGLPPDVDAKVGSAGAQSFRAQYEGKGEVPEAARERVDRIFAELRGALTAEQATVLREPRVTVVVDEQVNAFALPGGEVFVLTGLLDRVAADDGMLRGVLAHELGHAVLRHGMRQLARSAAFSIALGIVLGDVDRLTQTLVGGAAQLERLGYSRGMETEADDFGFELLQRAGQSPEGLARFLESLESAPVPELLSTHPDPKARAEALRERLR
jgi:predicted Zn-dependent protease